MTPNFDPSDGIDLAAYFIIGLPALIAACAAWYGQRKTREHTTELNQKADATLYEVRNDHRANLRDDIDDMKQLVKDGFADTRKDIHGLREELRTERLERIEGDRQRRLGDL